MGRLKFRLGKIVATRAAIASLDRESVSDIFTKRYIHCDWGDISPGDQKSNDVAVKKGYRILAAYQDINEVKFLIITEADRSATTILLPSDY